MLKLETSKKFTIKKIVIYAILTTILFVQEQIFSFLPNIQLTVFLIITYTKVLGVVPTIIITIIHVLLDCILSGAISPIIAIPMLVGWLIIPITLGTAFKNAEKPIILALFGIIYSICYCLSFAIANCIFLDVNIKTYVLADIPFTILLSMSSFISILLLYEPTCNILKRMLRESDIK